MVRYIKYIIVIGMFILVSCKPNKSDVSLEPSPELQEEVNISSIGVVLSPGARKLTRDWLKFQNVKSKIENYSKITKTEALQNAKELSELIVDVSDTIDIEILNRPDMKVRFNVLNNHVLRLGDMETIHSITEEEVKNEVTKVLSAFSSLNEKINTLVKIDEFDIQSESPELIKEEIEKTERKYSSSPSSRASVNERLEEIRAKRKERLKKRNLKNKD